METVITFSSGPFAEIWIRNNKEEGVWKNLMQKMNSARVSPLQLFNAVVLNLLGLEALLIRLEVPTLSFHSLLD